MSNQYNTIKTEAATLQGQLTAVQSELQTVKTTLATTQTNLADAISQLQRKQDEITAITNIKAAELKTANSIVTIDSVLHELGSNVDPGAAARILTGKGITVTVP
jgi:predicted  nucleic acid-binding Zn-ribbon protein